MGVTRLQFETNVAYWRKIRKSNGDIQYFRVDKDTGLARAKPQTSYAAANTHKIAPEDKEFDEFNFRYEQKDLSKQYSKTGKYTDAVNLKYSIVPPLSYNNVREEPIYNVSLNEVEDYIEERYADLHNQRNEYQAVFWHMNYSIEYDDGTLSNYDWNSNKMPYYNDIYLWYDDLTTHWENLHEANATYADVIIHEISAKFRHDETADI